MSKKGDSTQTILKNINNEIKPTKDEIIEARTTYNIHKDELKEIKKIKGILDPKEKILLIAKQARLKPGGALVTPNTIFATEKRLIIRNPTMLGLRASMESIPYDKITSVKLEGGVFSSTLVIRSPGLSELTRLGRRTGLLAWGRGEEGSIDAIPKGKGKHLLEIIREGIERAKFPKVTAPPVSVADEIKKLAELEDAGIITEKEFQTKKKKLLTKI